MLLEHFDEDVHAHLRIRLGDAIAQLDQVGKNFRNITNLMRITLSVRPISIRM
jgi:hypothetical protein